MFFEHLMIKIRWTFTKWSSMHRCIIVDFFTHALLLIWDKMLNFVKLQSAEGLSRVQAECGVCKVLDMLAKVLGMESARELYIEHIHNLMEIITTGYKGWSSGLPGKLLFQTFMRNAGDTVSENQPIYVHLVLDFEVICTSAYRKLLSQE